jgi:hypothetical protein
MELMGRRDYFIPYKIGRTKMTSQNNMVIKHVFCVMPYITAVLCYNYHEHEHNSLP